MGAINYGNQTLTFKYQQPSTSESFNNLLYNILPTGIYDRGTLSIINNSTIRVSPIEVLISDSTFEVSIKCKTELDVDITVTEPTPYVIMRLEWENADPNYVDFLSVSLEDLQDTDIILGKAVYELSELTDIDLSNRTYPDFNKYEQYDLVIDSSQKLLDWASNAYAGHCKKVFIKKGVWILNTGNIDLLALGTDILDCQEGAIIQFNDIPSDLNLAVGISYGTTLSPVFTDPTDEKRITNLHIRGKNSLDSQVIAGFFNCVNLVNCSSEITSDNGVSQFKYCKNLENCKAINDFSDELINDKIGFDYCSQLQKCISTGLDYTTGFLNCSNVYFSTFNSSGVNNLIGFSQCSELQSNIVLLENSNTTAIAFSTCSTIYNSVVSLNENIDLKGTEYLNCSNYLDTESNLPSTRPVRDSNGNITASEATDNSHVVVKSQINPLVSFKEWDETYSYSLNEPTFYEGVPYKSLANNNTGNTPSSSTSFWEITGGSDATGGGGGGTAGVDLIGIGKIGSGLSVSDVGTPTLASLNSTDVAFIDTINTELRTYRFNGTSWLQIGDGLSVSGASYSALTALNSTDVAFIDSGNRELRTYRFNGTTWTQVGYGRPVSNVGIPALAALSSTHVALIDGTSGQLRTYRFDGTGWATVGSGLSVSAGIPALTALNSTDVAFIDYDNKELRTYRFIGNSWSQVGTGLSVSSALFPSLATLNSTDVAFIDHINKELKSYRFDGTAWTQVGASLSISGSYPAIAALNLTDVALITYGSSELRTYRFLFSHDFASTNIVADYEVPEIATGKSIVIRRASAYDGDPITISPPPGATFEGLSSLELYDQYSYVELERISSTEFAIKDESVRLLTDDQKDALVGTSGTPSATNRYVTETDPIFDAIGGTTGHDLIGIGKIGSGLSVSDVGTPTLASLNSTDVAFIDMANAELRTYRFNGTTWTQVGTGLFISGVGGSALTALTETDVAFIDMANDELRTYRFNGASWTQVGTGLFISGAGVPALTSLNSTDVAFIDASNDELRTYRFNGASWTQVGTGLYVGGYYPAITALNSTDVAFIDPRNAELRTYRFNGASWTQVGTGLSVGAVTYPALATLNSTDVAFIDTTNDELRTYRFDGSTWSQVGTGLPVSVSYPSLASLNSTDVAFIDTTNGELRTYKFFFDYDSTSINTANDFTVSEFATGKSIVIRRTSAYDGNAITITPPSGATFEGLASLSLYGRYSFVELERISSTVFVIKALNDNHEITPMMTFGEGSTGITYSTQVGYATVDKHRVRANGRVTITSKGTSTGRMGINLQGLPPVIIPSGAISFTCGAVLCALISYTGQIQAYISVGSNKLYFIQSPETGGTQSFITSENLVNGSEVYFNIDYQWR